MHDDAEGRVVEAGAAVGCNLRPVHATIAVDVTCHRAFNTFLTRRNAVGRDPFPVGSVRFDLSTNEVERILTGVTVTGGLRIMSGRHAIPLVVVDCVDRLLA